MHNVSQLYKDTVVSAGTLWQFKARITLKDGTVYDLTESDIAENGMTLMSQVSEAAKLHIGGPLPNTVTLTLNNFDGRYSLVDFSDAIAVIYIGLIVEQSWEKGNVPEWVCVGTFISEGSKEVAEGFGVQIELVDQTYNFEKEYYNSKLKYPATLRQILEDACDCCGVVLATHDFLNADYVVQEWPGSGADTPIRTIVDWVTQLAGCYAAFDEYGKMELRWYDTESDPVADVRYPESAWTFDVVLTGIKAMNYLTDEEIMLGTGEYIVDLTANRLIQGDCSEMLEKLSQKLFGFHFRPFTAEITPNPAIEAGDPVAVYDSRGNAHRSYAMVCDYSLNGMTQLMAGSETPACNNHYQGTPAHLAVSTAKTNTEKKINVYDTYAKQFTAMASAAVGYYTTEETQDDGSVILYAHDKPKLEDSKIIWKKTGLVVAVSNNGLDGPWRGLDKDGNAILNDIAAQTIVANKIVSGRMETQDGRFYLDLDKGESTATKLIGGSLIGDREVEAVIGQKNDDPNAYEGVVLNIDGETKIALNYPIEGLESILPTGLYVVTPEGKTGFIKFTDNQMLIHPPGTAKEGLTTRFDGDVMLTGESKLRGLLGIPVQVEACEIEKDLIVHGNLHVDGEKTRVVKTSKGMVGVNAYEMAEPYFGDIGESRTNENGQARVDIDPLFAETVNTSCPYQVFVYPYCEGNFYVSKRAKDYFVVQGPKNGAFGYEIKARQKGYERSRLSNV